MASFRQLREYAQESGALRELTAALPKFSIVTGVSLSLNPYWVLALEDEDRASDTGLQRFDLLPGFPFEQSWRDLDGLVALLTSSPFYRRRDLHRVPRDDGPSSWLEFSTELGFRKSPIFATIGYSLPTPRVPERGDRPDEEREEGDAQRQFESLREIVGASSFPARMQMRAVSRLAGAPEIVAGSSTGTMGGALETPRMQRFGMTCTHVVGKGQMVTDGQGNGSGSCVHDTPLVEWASAGGYDPLDDPASPGALNNGPASNNLDCAMIDGIDTLPRCAGTAGIAADLSTGQHVIIRGRHRDYPVELGSLALSEKFVRNGKTYQFRNLIEIRRRFRLVGGALGRSLGPPLPRSGDSGSWLLTEDDQRLWGGVFIGDNGERGYAVRARLAHRWAENVTGEALS